MAEFGILQDAWIQVLAEQGETLRVNVDQAGDLSMSATEGPGLAVPFTIDQIVYGQDWETTEYLRLAFAQIVVGGTRKVALLWHGIARTTEEAREKWMKMFGRLESLVRGTIEAGERTASELRNIALLVVLAMLMMED